MRLITFGLAALLAGTSVASASSHNFRTSSYDAPESYRSYIQYSDRYADRSTDPSFSRGRVSLGEVSADPRDGVDDVPLHGAFAQLELRAREAPVRLRGVTVRFADGSVVRHDLHRVLEPGETLRLDTRRAPLEGIDVDYGNPEDRWSDRTPARLEFYGIGRFRMTMHR